MFDRSPKNRMVKFPMKFANGNEVRELDQYRENFGVEIVHFARNKGGNLYAWLKAREYYEMADAVMSARETYTNDLDLYMELGRIFGYEIDLDSLDMKDKLELMRGNVDRPMPEEITKPVSEFDELKNEVISLKSKVAELEKESNKYKKLLDELLAKKEEEERIKKELEIKNNTFIDGSLMWQDTSDMPKLTFGEIVEYVNNLKLFDFDDWRLPTKNELEKLSKKTFDLKYSKDDWYWSTSSNSYYSDYGWAVYFYNNGSCIAYPNADSYTYSNMIRCVIDIK